MSDSVPDTPIKDKKTVPVSPDDEDAHETIATVPVAATLTPTQRFTQPTQIVDEAFIRPSDSIVQVAASSPIAPSHSPPRRGILSSLLAPPGTQFRSPSHAARPAKRSPILDLDDGPTYRGGSSDEEENKTNQRTDIQPAMFERTRSPDKVAESPVRPDASALDRFKEITAGAKFDPTSNGVKRSAEHMNDAEYQRGVATKKVRQVGPSRAQPVAPSAQSTDHIENYRVKVKVERMLKVVTNKTVQQCINALVVANGNYDTALDIVTNDPAQPNDDAAITIDSSEDELASPATNLPTAKQQIRARNTIHDKYKAFNHPPTVRDHEPEAKPRGRLVRGARSRASPDNVVLIDSDRTPPRESKGRLQKGRRQPMRSPSPNITDSEDEDVRVDSSKAEKLEGQVFKFLNTCGTRDLSDIAAIPEDDARVITDNRPYETLDDIRVVQAPVDENAKPKGKGKPRRTPKPIGDKIVTKCLEMWEGYMAIDSLVSECANLGKPVADEMKKWGIDVFGKRDGDLELTSMTNGNAHDSGIATPSSNRQSPDGKNEEDEDDEGPVVATRKSKSQGYQFITQPDIMADDLVMKDYQIVGINWLALLYEKKMSCILADDMGLGKTCQVIGFLAHLFTKDIKGPHLIVVPSSTIENWLREFAKFCPTLHVIPYYAGQNERAYIREQIEENRDEINVVITTYTIAKGKLDAKFLRDQDFTVCVYDEGHMLKNSQSQLYEKLIRIPAKFRLLLTGTPLQNNLQELASLLGFILPRVFQQHKDDLQAIFSNKAKTTDADDSHSALLSRQRVDRAKSMLKPFVLRRKKHQVIDLPAKVCRVQYCDMKASQSDIYDSEKDKVRQLLEDRAAGKKTGSKSANILMKLRMAAIHPLLARRNFDDSVLRKMSKACLKDPLWAMSDPDVIFEELTSYNDFECHRMCIDHKSSLGKFHLKNEEWMDSGKVEHLKELLTRFIANGDRTLIFSQFTLVMDILEEVMETLKIQFVRLDGRTSVEDRQSILDAFYENTNIPVFLLSTKAGGAGINLACANKVVIFDSSFNPQEDVQAENRAHRVGQVRDVEVFRFVTRGTIEEQIYALGQTKLALDQAVAGDEDGSKKGEEAGIRVVESMMLSELGSKKAD